MSEQVEQVTKPKSEGRVAAGKKLAEWNRKNKENLLKNKEQVESSDQQEPQSQTSSNLSSQTSTVVYGGLAIVVVIGVALYVYRKKPAPPSNNDRPAALQDHDIFRMN